MHPALNKHIQAYDQVLKKLWEASEGLTDEEINTKPDANSWSIAQVHEHLMLSEKFSIQYLEKKLQYPHGLKKAGLKSWWNFSRIIWMLKAPFKVKAPKHVAQVPEYSSIGQLQKDWETTRKRMKVVLESVPDELVHSNLYKHPLTGRFSLAQMLRFFIVHISGHIKQVRRIRKAIG